MLEKIFGSRARVKMLKLFLLHPNDKFFIRELSRKLKLQINSVRRELENLEKFGILISSPPPIAGEKQAGEKTSDYKPANQEKKYFQANADFVLFEEVKALIIKAQILYERDFIDKLHKIGKVKLLILSGIFVNNYGAQTDLLIVGRFHKNKFLRLIKELEQELGHEINFTLMDSKEFKYRRDITDIFLYEILENRKIVVIDDAGIS
ncbi:hypothetical protein KKC83_03580 [Patescibacteria group bacterium]|nr:hypothetical protein [Candidatus Falkowbacteria bacterium]MBU3905488.1 hypothetical protein [Patescibacteria group bacterium]MBU4015129.1 hypothetical protein [Patescibacteria group bacterium]MBU4026595.1 hypothetical protein [Patescibacteria group bacterium]MBU4073494.1 hypothetical protein [Patescibacteria group bacterium]